MGVTIAEFEFEESLNDGSFASDIKTGFGVNLGLGSVYKIDDNVSIRLRAKYILLNGIKPTKVGGVGEVENMFTLGLGFQVKL